LFLKLFIEKRVLYACAIATASLIMASLGITGLVLISMAASDGLTVLFGHRWAGELVTGAILLLFTTIAGLVIFRERAEDTGEANKAGQKLDWWVETIGWAKAHPEAILGAAALLGFLVATLLLRPRRVEQPVGPAPAEPSKPRRSGSYLAFLTELFALARPFIAAFMASHASPQSPKPSHNGGHASAAQPSPASATDPNPKAYERQST